MGMQSGDVIAAHEDTPKLALIQLAPVTVAEKLLQHSWLKRPGPWVKHLSSWCNFNTAVTQGSFDLNSCLQVLQSHLLTAVQTSPVSWSGASVKWAGEHFTHNKAHWALGGCLGGNLCRETKVWVGPESTCGGLGANHDPFRWRLRLVGGSVEEACIAAAHVVLVLWLEDVCCCPVLSISCFSQALNTHRNK